MVTKKRVSQVLGFYESFGRLKMRPPQGNSNWMVPPNFKAPACATTWESSKPSGTAKERRLRTLRSRIGSLRNRSLKSFRSEHAMVVPVLVRTNGLLTQFERAVRSVHRILKDDEILIVVDDGSPTQFQKAIQASCSWPKIVLLRHCPNVGPASSRNTAMDWCRSNRSEIQTVCFLDADCVVPDANWSAAHRAQQKEVPGIVCGRTISLNPETWVSLYHDVFGTLNGRMFEDENNLLYGATCNMSIRFDALPDGFRFDPQFRTPAFEDVEFCVRARKTGLTKNITFLSGAVIKHDYSTDALGFIEQFWRYGQGHHRMLEAHPEYDAWFAASSPMSNFSMKKLPSD
mmetsp:Transcript_32523/g.127539  ORF Transcript_32523/g.127539 Transcript_32523/m.127539 type:complete len:345 (-) Transcript_32523:2806-3840(-)